MSNFFSLEGGGGKYEEHPHNHHQQQEDNSLYLFKNEEIYNKGGFEQWQQYHQLQQLRSTQDVNFSVGPSSSGDDQPSLSYDYRSSNFRVSRYRSSSTTSGSGSIYGQNCLNLAKKTCTHMRCRTCCKSRGFHCDTHVKSTWVPAAKRKERPQNHQIIISLQNQDQSQDKSQNQVILLRGGDENYTPNKRPRDNNNNSQFGNSPSLPCTRLTTSSSGAHFPAKLNSPAMFRCIKVSNAVNDGEEQYAYQTAVNIGGHIFKGILYDQGPDTTRYSGCVSGGVVHHQKQPLLNLITASTSTNITTTTTSAMVANVGVPVLDPSVYPTPLISAFMATGTTFFQPPRS